MMKKNILFMIAAVSLSVVSCKKVLDKKPLDLITEDQVWTSASLAQANVYNAYNVMNYFTRYDGTDAQAIQFSDNQSDNAWTHYLSASNKDDRTWTVSNDFGWNNFGDIRKENTAIANLLKPDNIAKLGGSGAANPILGQAYFLKAMSYYKQARKFGGFIIVDESLDQFGGDATNADVVSKLKLPRASMKQTYDYIIALIDKATPLLSATAPVGQISKGACYALLSEVCLHGGVYMKYFENVDPAPYFNRVIDAATALDAMGKYSLVAADDYGRMFNDYTFAQSAKEIILNFSRSSTYTTYNDLAFNQLFNVMGTSYLNLSTINIGIQPLTGFTVVDGVGTNFPDPNAIESAYYVIDLDGKARRWEQSQRFAANFNIVSEADLYFPSKIRSKRVLKATASAGSISPLMFGNRDKRFYQTIAYDSSLFVNNRIYVRKGGNMHSLSFTRLSREVAFMTGFGWRKYLIETQNIAPGQQINATYPIFRLGRVYLNVAEAYLLMGNEAKAKEFINKTRTTHGGLPALTVETGLELQRIYLDERQAELNLENDRYWTLLRTGLGFGPVNLTTGLPEPANKGGVIALLNRGDNPHPTIEIEVKPDFKLAANFFNPRSYFYRELYYPQTDNYWNFDPKKHYLLNVPASELAQNPNLTQNANWK
jgi:hypothetical protein